MWVIHPVFGMQKELVVICHRTLWALNLHCDIISGQKFSTTTSISFICHHSKCNTTEMTGPALRFTDQFYTLFNQLSQWSEVLLGEIEQIGWLCCFRRKLSVVTELNEPSSLWIILTIHCLLLQLCVTWVEINTLCLQECTCTCHIFEIFQGL